MSTRVAIVNAGGRGDHDAIIGSYDDMIDMFVRALTRLPLRDGLPAARVRVAKSTEDAILWVEGCGTIIYVTSGMNREAKEVAAKHRHIRVILITGEIPEGEVVYLDKHWIDPEQIVRVAL